MTLQTDVRTDGRYHNIPTFFFEKRGDNQVIYLSLPIYSPGFKTLASIVFRDSLLTRFHAQSYKDP